MAAQVHPIYRFCFLWIDPLLTIIGIYGNIFNHSLAIQAFLPNSQLTEEMRPFLYQIGGMGATYLCLFVLLLRYTDDVNVWKIVQFGITWADFTMFTSIYVALRHEGRLASSAWRVEDWLSIISTSIVTVLRISFVLGIGIKEAGAKRKRV